MKKIFAIMFLVGTLILIGQCNSVEAADVYVGTYDSGYDAYLMTESIRGDYNSRFNVYGAYYCTIKAVSGGDVIYVDYSLHNVRRETALQSAAWRFKNSQGFDGVVGAGTPIERTILNYLLRNYR